MKKNLRKMTFPLPMKPLRPAIPALEWLSDVSGRVARATAIGSKRMLIENHTGIQHYSDNCVCLRTACGILRVHGSNLSLNEVRPSALIVHGSIRMLELPDEENVQ